MQTMKKTSSNQITLKTKKTIAQKQTISRRNRTPENILKLSKTKDDTFKRRT